MWIGVGVAFLIYALTSANQMLSVYSLSILMAIIFWLRDAKAPLIFQFCLGVQWLQVSVKILQANLVSLPINEYTKNLDYDKAVYYELTGILVLYLTFRIILRKVDLSPEKLKDYISEVKILPCFIIFTIWSFVGSIMAQVNWGGLFQPVYVLINFKWVFYCLIVVSTFFNKRNYHWFFIAFFFEFTSSLVSYFSSFKDVIFFTILSLVIVQPKIRFKQAVFFVPLLVLIYVMFVVWTGVKSDYRHFLSEGQETQTVNVNKDAGLDFLQKKVENFSSNDFQKSQERALDRLSYSTMLANTQHNVPSKVPHENGQLSLDAILHIVQPRFLFPNKKVLDDSEIANKYSGKHYYGASRGTSVSLGYFAELYVDYGWSFVGIPLFLMGWLLAYLVRKIIKISEDPLFAQLFMLAIFYEFKFFETTLPKIAGSVLLSYLMYRYIYLKYFKKNFYQWVYLGTQNPTPDGEL